MRSIFLLLLFELFIIMLLFELVVIGSAILFLVFLGIIIDVFVSSDELSASVSL